MKHTTKLLLILALVATTASSVPGSSHARRNDGARPTELRASTVSGPTQESWWGRAAAFACRQGFRYLGTPGFAQYGGFCVIAFLDAILS